MRPSLSTVGEVSDRGARVVQTHAELLASSLLEPVELGGEDERRWGDCDLASLAENRLGLAVNPRCFDERQREEVRARATTEACALPSRRRFETCYWLREGDERVGTVALESSEMGSRRLRLSSFYVFPHQRRRGVGTRTLSRLKSVLDARGFGIRLETSWCWQAAVRFYLRTGFWLHGWKRELTFCWDPGDPPPLFSHDRAQAGLSVEVGGARLLLARAERRGEALALIEEVEPSLDAHSSELWWRAPSTLSLWLALHVWPLIRSAEEWQNSRYSDFGSPEALAYKIAIWEAWDRKRGFRVATPRIPGLRYPTWGELEAEWERPTAG